MKVHKFGGTSVLNANRYRNVHKIITEMTPPGPKAVVVSAMKGVTDDLLRVVEMARQNDEMYQEALGKIYRRHIDEATSLLAGEERERLFEVLIRDHRELGEILRGIWLVRTTSEKITELVSGMGEVWSAQILNAYFRTTGFDSEWLDARQILVVDNAGGRIVIDWEKSRSLLQAWRARNPQALLVVTGFVAATTDGTYTTLGRNGSDYSASIFGALLDSDEVFIWTDVDGVLSADPRLVPEAVILDEMSYNEVAELAYFGAKVVHPATMAPAMAKNCTIWIKNSLNPSFSGTKIHRSAKSKRAIKGFSTIDGMCLLNVEGSGMVGVPGVAERLFGALRSAGVSVVLISQASSEHSICLSVPENQGSKAKAAVEDAFYGEMQKGLIQTVQVTEAVSILAAVGDAMAQVPGMAGKFFTSLGQSGVNVRAIAQGSSERNISAVIDSRDATKALRSVHSTFVLPHQRISLGLIGAGLIGGTFLKQLGANLEKLKLNAEVDVQVLGICNSKRMVLMDHNIPLDRWAELLASDSGKSEPFELKKFIQHIKPQHVPHAVVIEATASGEFCPHYKDWLREGLHIISPNKRANSGSMQDYQAIREAAREANRHFLYATNVGAGLPILQTLRDLCATGDEIHLIQGVLSGTLSFIFNQYDGTRRFSEIVRSARDQGYTEPDPREDLSGQDVMRKLLILAREAGVVLEPNEVVVESLVPPALQSITSEEFLNRLEEMDEEMDGKLEAAKGRGLKLRFVASFDRAASRAHVGLEAVPPSHAFAQINGTDNVVSFTSARYSTQPLVIRGPGAGPEVTAAGVFADLLRLSRYLGALS
jgi:aspartokinase/homoserine dehydrogenase 1